MATQLCAMEQRLMGDEARQLEAQLPRKVVALLERCPRHKDRPYQKLNRTQLLGMVAEDLGVSMEQAERITRMVLSTVREHGLWHPMGKPAARRAEAGGRTEAPPAQGLGAGGSTPGGIGWGRKSSCPHRKTMSLFFV